MRKPLLRAPQHHRHLPVWVALKSSSGHVLLVLSFARCVDSKSALLCRTLLCGIIYVQILWMTQEPVSAGTYTKMKTQSRINSGSRYITQGGTEERLEVMTLAYCKRK